MDIPIRIFQIKALSEWPLEQFEALSRHLSMYSTPKCSFSAAKLSKQPTAFRREDCH